MKYRFSNYKGKKKNYIRLVLRTEDPLLYRAGDVIDYPDVDTKELDELVINFFANEKKKAQTFGKWLTYKNRKKDALETKLKETRCKARELFFQMEKSNNKDELAELNLAFTKLTEKALMTEQAFTYQNPWYSYYKKLENPMEAVEMVVVRGTITDPNWFENPLYPADKNYARFGMKKAKANVKPEKQPHGRGSQNGKVGRPKNPVIPYYVEPELTIISYEPVGFFSEYRTILPQECLGL